MAATSSKPFDPVPLAVGVALLAILLHRWNPSAIQVGLAVFFGFLGPGTGGHGKQQCG